MSAHCEYIQVDYSDKTLTVYSDSGKVIHRGYVAQGQTTRFSNIPGSKQSSLGKFRLAEHYVGKHGKSIRIDGLSGSLNDNARRRLVVIHSAPYVTDDGVYGNSWGCFAVSQKTMKILLELPEGTLLYART